MPSRNDARGGGRRDGGHAPFWPPSYCSLRHHKLCFLAPLGNGQFRILWDDGGRSQPFETYDEWKALLSAHGIGVDCFVGELEVDGRGFPWITQAIQDQQAKVTCSKNGGVTAIHCRVGRLHLDVGSFNSWHQHWRDVDPLDLLYCIRTIGEYTQTGSNLSPGSLGTRCLKETWKESSLSYARVSRCCVTLLKMLKEYSIAGRVETFTDRRVMFSIELDLRSAYASCCEQIPWGTPRRIASRRSPAEASGKYATWFCECTVSVVTKLAISPVPIKVKGRWTWATKPGVYKTWMWREEVEACIRAGVIVEVEHGWGWKRLSNRLRPWVEQMERYRVYFESVDRLDMAKMVKNCTVAAIGWLGCYLFRYSIEATYRKGNLPLCDRKGAAPVSKFTLHPSEDASAGAPNHLHTYIMMRCRLKVYEREVEELWSGNELLNVNFDAIRVVRPSSLPIGRSMGQWKQEPLHARTEAGLFPRARWTNAQEKVTIPGVRRDSKLRLSYLDASSAEVKRMKRAPVDATTRSAPSVESPRSGTRKFTGSG